MKNIIISGKSGFIGNVIFKDLIKSEYSVENVNLRQSKDDLKNIYKKKNFDIFIHAAGIHPYRTELNEIKTFDDSKELLKKIEIIFSNSKKIILISSFINLINKDNRIITETNKIYSSKNDNFYKKSKILTEKYFKLLQRKYKKELIIIYPCHVIGPDDFKKSPNGAFLIKSCKKSISLYGNVNYPITDVREISNYIIYCLKNNLNSKKKILLDRSIILSELFQLLKSYKKKIKLYFRIDIRFYYLAHIFFNFMQKFFGIKKNPFPISTYYYLKLNPEVIPQLDNQYKIKYKIEKTVRDTVEYFNL